MTLAIRHVLLLVALLVGQVSLALAGPRVAILSDEMPTSKQFHQLLSGELRQAGLTEVVANGGQRAATVEGLPSLNAGDIVIAIGASALRQMLRQPVSKQVIVVLITRSAFDEELARLPGHSAREMHAIVLDQPLGRYLDLVRLALPQRQRVGVILGSSSGVLQKPLERVAAERDMSVSFARAFEDAIFIPQLERLLSQSDILLALPDPGVHNRNTVQPLLLTTYRAGVPVVAYSEAYVQAGALIALFSTPAQIARQTIELVQQLTQGRAAPAVQGPRYFSVSVNNSVARSLGLTLPNGEVLRDRLMQAATSTD